MALLTKRQLILIVLFKICLPTFDIYSDIGTVYELLTWEDNKRTWRNNKNLYTALGSSTILFMVLGLLLTIPHYLKNEMTWRRRLKTLPFLLLLCWPQFRAAEVIWIALVVKDVEIFEERLSVMELEITQIGNQNLNLKFWVTILNCTFDYSETFVESIPQTHISCIALFSGILLNGQTSHPQRKEAIFFTSFVLSVIASSYGMSNFLKNGPAKLVQKPGPFLLVFLANGACLVGKAFWLAAILGPGGSHLAHLNIFGWLGLSILPNVILVRNN